MASEYTRQLIAEIIESFDFSDYGMNDVDEVKKFGAGRAEWLKDLAAHIADRLDTDPKREALPRPHLIEDGGMDWGEIEEVRLIESYDSGTQFTVYTKQQR